MPTYTIRYHCADCPGAAALLVEDAAGATYLFSGGQLQARCADAAACARLLALLRRRGTWVAVPATASRTLAGLHALAGTTHRP